MFLESLDTAMNVATITKQYFGQHFILMESLTTEREYFKTEASRLTGGRVNISAEYLDRVFSSGYINQHRQYNKQLNAREIFESWEQWKQCLVCEMFFRYDVTKTYKKIGYDFGFMI